MTEQRTKVLVWTGKSDPVYIDASDPAAAFMGLFWRMRREGFYHHMEPADQTLYERALLGDTGAAEKLLRRRRDAEYEQWSLITTEKP